MLDAITGARARLILVLAGLALTGCPATQHGASEATLQQAARYTPEGARLYREQCGGCHGARGEGSQQAPPVMGTAALPLYGAAGDHGPFRTAQDVFDYTKSNMPLPRNKVGTLTDEQYWRVVTYMLAGKEVALPEGGLSEENASGVIVNPG